MPTTLNGCTSGPENRSDPRAFLLFYPQINPSALTMPSFSEINPTYLLIAAIAIVVLLIVFFALRYMRSRSPKALAQVAQNGLKISVKYSQPHKRNRTIFGNVVPFGKVWRT